MTTVPDRVTTINVRKPAEWRLLERSQPMTADKSTERKIRKKIVPRESCVDQLPRRFAMGSVIIFVPPVSDGMLEVIFLNFGQSLHVMLFCGFCKGFFCLVYGVGRKFLLNFLYAVD